MQKMKSINKILFLLFTIFLFAFAGNCISAEASDKNTDKNNGYTILKNENRNMKVIFTDREKVHRLKFYIDGKNTYTYTPDPKTSKLNTEMVSCIKFDFTHGCIFMVGWLSGTRSEQLTFFNPYSKKRVLLFSLFSEHSFTIEEKGRYILIKYLVSDSTEDSGYAQKTIKWAPSLNMLRK